jgi:hypothetical protein
MRNALGPIGKLFPKSPAEEGPLSVAPDFMYIADAMRLPIPHVRAAGVDLMAAEGAGGSFGLAVSAPAGSAGTASLGSRGAAGGLAITNNITIQGGTFTDRATSSLRRCKRLRKRLQSGRCWLASTTRSSGHRMAHDRVTPPQ